ncbi:MAG: CoA transferase [Deltaproteobacteria bacterium]|nr:MAG: CoA transferase [Deltaproteobacteria bacterium]
MASGREKVYQPLGGYKVIDCSRLLPYQYCTLLLGDLGAEVLKIEEPGRGDYGRWDDFNEPGRERLAFPMANRNKKSLTLNLKEKAGREILLKLAEKYDVLLETFRPGAMERLGLDYRSVKEVNPRIIYCSGTGFGQTGPYRLKAGHDINYISLAGILGVSGIQTGRPVIPGVPFADMVGGGVFTALAIIAALLGREKTGEGKYLDVAMTDVMTSLNIMNIAIALSQKAGRGMMPSSLRGSSLCYNVYKTKDGKFVSIGDLESKFWNNFCRALGREELVDKQYHHYQDGDKTTESLKTLFASKTQAEWIESMKGVDDCFSPVYSPEEALDDPHLKSRGMITRMADPQRGEMLQLGFPALFSEELHYKRSPAPFLGENTREILQELGYRMEEIEKLKSTGTI